MDSKKIVEKFKQSLSQVGASEFEVFFLREHHSSVEVKDQELNSFEEAETMGASLRVIREGRLGFSYTTDLTDAGVLKAAQTALTTTRYSDPSPYLSLPEISSPPPSVDLDDCDPSYRGLSPKRKIESALVLEKAARAFDLKIKRVRGASYEGTLEELTLANSRGLFLQHQKTMNVLSLMAVAEEGDEAEVAFEFGFSSFFDRLNPEEVSRRGAKKALSYLGSRPGPTFKGPILLDPLVAAEILEVLASSFYADHRVKQCSLFENELGQKIISEKLTLVDDGCLKGGYASFPFDGEGVGMRRVEVVKGGVLNEILSDTEYASRLKRSSTGSSHREGIRRTPQVGHSNFFIPAGVKSLEEVLKTIPQGILMTELIGMHTANPISGDFSVGAQGFLIEKGEITTPLKQMALSGNLKTMMNQVEEVASDLRFSFKVGSPSLLISEMDVAGE